MFTRAARRDGFTLVELAIVLVIVGILIGGILVAQSMISTSKITAEVAQIQQFDAGVENFKTKYGYLPGDAPMFGGDGDGVIEITALAGAGFDNATSIFACEIANFWSDFDPREYTGYTCSGYVGIQALSSGPSKNVPLSKLGMGNSFFIASAISDPANRTFADIVNPRNFYAILAPSQAQVISIGGAYHFSETSSSNSSTKPADLLALDTKMDDGLADSGNVLSGAIGQQWSGITLIPLATCSSGATYAVQNNSYECTPLIRIGAQTGDPQ